MDLVNVVSNFINLKLYDSIHFLEVFNISELHENDTKIDYNSSGKQFFQIIQSEKCFTLCEFFFKW